MFDSVVIGSIVVGTVLVVWVIRIVELVDNLSAVLPSKHKCPTGWILFGESMNALDHLSGHGQGCPGTAVQTLPCS
jgi:hypothetical protein